MNDKFISRAVECYTEKLEEENILLKNILRKITNTFGRNAKGRTERELLDNILNILMYYSDVIPKNEEEDK